MVRAPDGRGYCDHLRKLAMGRGAINRDALVGVDHEHLPRNP
jgi:hypothetical protein